MSAELIIAAELLKNPLVAEALTLLGSTLVLVFTDRQRQWFRERDEGKCQFPTKVTKRKGEIDSYEVCGSPIDEIHHIVPQRWASLVLGWLWEQIDTGENGVGLCKKHHRDFIHKDMASAVRWFWVDKKAIEKVLENRKRLCERGKRYWDTKWDSVLLHIAATRTAEFEAEFPRRRNGHHTEHDE
ncbi:MAG TPA: HNH endonuclease [Patescibacteria group bacterium]|nr:HNH endonuclease [Patescibacteria group bacterium]